MADPRINLLSQETASKIAAGEVVEKPASVVKELVENAIDAGAKSITVEIVNGGLDLIRIIDDGQGILNEDITRAFQPHATSKIRSIDDIFSISTLGFRGEALPSVAAVSRTLLKSHASEEQDGMEIYVEGGEEKFHKFSAIDQGTIVDVRDLFYNVPARLKFLRTSQKEGSNVTDLMTRLALSRPDISFNYFNNEKQVFRTYGTGKLLDVIRTVYTRKIAEHASAFHQDFDRITISGYIGDEEIARGSRNQQTIFVNGRYVISRQLTAAVEQAFKSFITINKFPFFVLNLTIDPAQVDVNVHPQKAEIKFSDDRLMFKAVFDTVHAALRKIYQDSLGFLENTLDEQVSGGDKTYPGYQGGISEVYEQHSFFKDEKINDPDFLKSAEDPGNELNPVRKQNGSRETEDFRKEKEPTFPAWEGPNENIPVQEVSIPVDLRPYPEKAGNLERTDRENGLEQTGGFTGEKVSNPDRSTGHQSIEELSGRSAKFPQLKVIGQFNRTYILAELNNTLYLIDQHAAHEKIHFEHYMDEILTRQLVVQPLLVPEVIDLPTDDYSIFLENQDVFAAAGFTVEEFGDKILSIREVPLFLSSVSAQRYLGEILDNLKNLGKGTTREVRYLRIATAACKASVKARDELTIPEMEHLLEQLRFLEEPFTCPHGRPTMIRFSLNELEKMFRRIQS